MEMMEVLKNEYRPASSAWILIQAATEEIRYIGTIQCEDGNLVWHIFEDIK